LALTIFYIGWRPKSVSFGTQVPGIEEFHARYDETNGQEGTHHDRSCDLGTWRKLPI